MFVLFAPRTTPFIYTVESAFAASPPEFDWPVEEEVVVPKGKDGAEGLCVVVVVMVVASKPSAAAAALAACLLFR